MQKAFTFILLLIAPFMLLSGQDYGEDNATQLGDFVRKESLIYIYHPLLPCDFTMDDIIRLENYLGVTHKSYDYVTRDLLYQYDNKLLVIKYKDSIISLLERAFDKRLIINRMEINNSDFPLRGKLRMGMLKKEFCEFIGVTYNKYININEIFIALYDAPSMPIKYVFNDLQELIAVHRDAWLIDSEYLEME